MEMKLTTRDHFSVGLHAICIWFSLKLCMSTVPYVAIYGYFLILVNVWSFNSYCYRRKNEIDRT